ncbi:extensin family protein [Consotaella salsifontis]|uniref:Extensin-like protein C-terminus n=1 Tax=Consotaella salsifontis TaxID=1365950 RepID=A0A1T4PSR8_9HYPH|nr:extensin family protein [Consotaella salsifontis]SJZ94595.1 Extensin-like protein C-terminus [Consotaella salsifontis]
MYSRKIGWSIIALAAMGASAASALFDGSLRAPRADQLVWGGPIGDAYQPSAPTRQERLVAPAAQPVQQQRTRAPSVTVPQSVGSIPAAPMPLANIPQQAVPVAVPVYVAPAESAYAPAPSRPQPLAAVPVHPAPMASIPVPSDPGRPRQMAVPRAPVSAAPQPARQEASLPPLEDMGVIDNELNDAAPDPWNGLQAVTPGARPAAPALRQKPKSSLPTYVTYRPAKPAGRSLLDRLIPHGALESESPSGYSSMPSSEMACRQALTQMGVRFVDATSISASRSCGIDYPVKVAEILPGIAMKPAATLNCQAALKAAQWMKNEVVPAARSTLWKTPTAVINMSSYRCTRIAGSRTISEHASGNALDVGGFLFASGEKIEVEKKGFFDFRERPFQKAVRQGACRYFGTVLGPGYNEDHADHLHIDAKQRRRGVCK